MKPRIILRRIRRAAGLSAALLLVGGAASAQHGDCAAIAVQNQTLWSGGARRVEAWDLRGEKPARLTTVGFPASPQRLVPLGENHVAVLCGEGGAFVVGRSNANPVWLGTPVPVLDVAERRGVLAVACGGRGVFLLAVTNPVAPVLLGGFSGATDARAVGFVASLVCVADGTNGLKFLDASDPGTPQLLTACPAAGGFAIEQMAISTTLIVTAQGRALRRFDASDPRHPVLTAERDLPSAPRRLLVHDRWVWAACGGEGGLAFDLVHDLVQQESLAGTVLDLAAAGRRVFVAEGQTGWRARASR